MGNLDDFIADYIRDEELVPGISAAIMKDGICIYRKTYGYANLENKIKINDNTSFYLASLSKSFTAASVMLLHQKGMLDITDKIRKYFNDLPEYYDDIKIVNLVKHTSGLRDYFTSYFEKNMNVSFITNQEVYDFILKENILNFSAGDRFEYSNTGYVLLAMLIEKVSGLSFSEFLKESFFIPLGMKNTYVYTENGPIIPNRAYGYKQIDGEYFCHDYYVLTTGDGGIYSCIEDMLIWLQSFDDEVIFSREIIEELFKVEKLNDGVMSKYLFGWFNLEEDNKRIIFHTGQLGGFTNIMIKIPGNKFSIIIFTNCYRESWQKVFKAVHNCAVEAYNEHCFEKI